MADQEKDWVRTQFGNNAENYRDEVLFAAGADLVEMVRAVDLSGCLGSGAGHTASAFVPRVAECIGCDLTQEMVAVAEGLARQRGTRNVSFEVGDAEYPHLPICGASFFGISLGKISHTRCKGSSGWSTPAWSSN